jgi:hypothetical protein
MNPKYRPAPTAVLFRPKATTGKRELDLQARELRRVDQHMRCLVRDYRQAEPTDFDPVPPESEVRRMTPAQEQAFADEYQREQIASANSQQIPEDQT